MILAFNTILLLSPLDCIHPIIFSPKDPMSLPLSSNHILLSKMDTTRKRKRNLVLSHNGGSKVIYTKYSKHRPYTLAHTIDCVCCKMLNHGLNHGLFFFHFSIAYILPHWIENLLGYLNFIFSFSTAGNGPLCPDIWNIIFIWIVWRTLYVYLWVGDGIWASQVQCTEIERLCELTSDAAVH